MFTEPNTVVQIMLNTAAKRDGKPVSMVREDASSYGGEAFGAGLRPAR